MPTTTHPKAYAAALIAAIAVLVGASLFAFNGGFSDTGRVTVIADRAGLLMTPGAKVKFRGLEIGRVTGVTQEGDQAHLTLDVDSHRLAAIPANAGAAVTSTTVFGAKFVAFEDPEHPDGKSMAPGATITTDRVSVEINTVFQQLTDILRQVEPEKLSVSLHALAAAVGGDRGKGLGQAVDTYADIVGRLHRQIGAVDSAIVLTGRTASAYAPATQPLMQNLRHTTATARTITDSQRDFDLMLANVTGLARTGRDFLDVNSAAMAKTVALLTPTTALFAVYAPELTCMIKGMDVLLRKGLPALGGKDPGIRLSISFLQGIPMYGYPGNLPKVNAKGGPHCFGLPDVPNGMRAPYLVTDSGVNPFKNDPRTSQFQPKDLMTLLLGRPQGRR